MLKRRSFSQIGGPSPTSSEKSSESEESEERPWKAATYSSMVRRKENC
jgi:hypothetical protein